MRFAALILALCLTGFGCASGGSLRNDADASDVVRTARKQIGVKYKFGGADPRKGFDCSGLVNYSFGKAGIKLPRSTKSLYGEGSKVPKGSLKPGDLVFFDITGGGVSHVGIYSGGDNMIHAPSSGSRVREESISISYWLKRFVGARRLD